MSLEYETYEEGIFKCLLSIAKSLAVIASASKCTYEAERPDGRHPENDDPDLKMWPDEEIYAGVDRWDEGDFLYKIVL